MQSEYHLLVDWDLVNKKLKKYPKDIRTKIKRDISLLKYNPKKGTHLETYKDSSLFKKRYQEIEIYYRVEERVVIVLDVKYIGSVELMRIESGIKSGRCIKKTTAKQNRVIEEEKRKFRKYSK